MGKGGWPNRHITFIVAEKNLLHSSSCSYTVYGGRGLGRKRRMGGGGGIG